MPRPPLLTVLREWGRIGWIGFGGPPAHIALLRELCVERRRYLDAAEFEDAVAACNLLPGPASTQLAIFTAWRVGGGLAGGLVGGLGNFIRLAEPLQQVLRASNSPGRIHVAKALYKAIGLDRSRR